MLHKLIIVGKLALDIMSKEYSTAMNEEDNSPWCVFFERMNQNLPIHSEIFIEKTEKSSLMQIHYIPDSDFKTEIPNNKAQNKEDETIVLLSQISQKIILILWQDCPLMHPKLVKIQIIGIFENTFDELDSIKKV